MSHTLLLSLGALAGSWISSEEAKWCFRQWPNPLAPTLAVFRDINDSKWLFFMVSLAWFNTSNDVSFIENYHLFLMLIYITVLNTGDCIHLLSTKSCRCRDTHFEDSDFWKARQMLKLLWHYTFNSKRIGHIPVIPVWFCVCDHLWQ